MPLDSRNQSETEPALDQSNSTEKQILQLRSRISDLGFELDAEKAGSGLAMGAGVFLILLAALAAYDLWTGKAGVWMAVGITRDTLNLVAYGCGGVGAVLIAHAVTKRLRRDRKREAELSELEQQYSRLIDNKAAGSDETEKN